MPAKTTGARPSRRSFDHAAAELYWRNDGGQRRSWRDVAAEFGVTEGAVFRAACREGWHERAWEIEEQARREAQRRAVKTVEQRIREKLAIIDASKVAYARGLQSGKVTVSATELAALLKVEQLLTGGVTERTSDALDRDPAQARVIEAIAEEVEGLTVEQLEHEEMIDSAGVDATLDADADAGVAEWLLLPVGDADAPGDEKAEGVTLLDARRRQRGS